MDQNSPLDTVFAELWSRYADLSPQVRPIEQLFRDRGDHVVNDHVAFRTFDIAAVGIPRLAKPFLDRGYTPADTYRFEEKKLFAQYFAPPEPHQPKVFISELKTTEFSEELQETVAGLVDQLSEEQLSDPGLINSGRLWTVDLETYNALSAESEYAGWLAAFGFCANHFTVSINDLESLDECGDVAALIADNGYAMNTSGGIVKGSPDVLLEQCSTRAAQIPVQFSDGTSTIPSCYYEFARRYPLPDGSLYQGFVAASADKIFESTDR